MSHGPLPITDTALSTVPGADTLWCQGAQGDAAAESSPDADARRSSKKRRGAEDAGEASGARPPEPSDDTPIISAFIAGLSEESYKELFDKPRVIRDEREQEERARAWHFVSQLRRWADEANCREQKAAEEKEAKSHGGDDPEWYVGVFREGLQWARLWARPYESDPNKESTGDTTDSR